MTMGWVERVFTRWSLIQVLLCCCLIPTAFGNELTAAERKRTRQINIGIVGPQKQLDPTLGYSVFDFLVIQCIYQTLVRMNAEGNITSELAQKWEISRDGLSYKFYINPLARFSDGSTVTARDVGISLSRHLWPESKSIVKNYLSDVIQGGMMVSNNEMVRGISIIAPQILEIKLRAPYPPFLNILAMPGFSITPAEPDRRAKHVGSGHFVAAFDAASGGWIFTPNAHYSGLSNKITKMRIIPLKDLDAATNAVTTKALDLLLGLMSEVDSEFSKKLPSDFGVYRTNSLSFAHMIFNMKSLVFRNIKIRALLGAYLNSLAKETSDPTNGYHYLKTFLPRGVMPLAYYDRELSIPTTEEIARVAAKELAGKKIRLIFSEGRLPKPFIAKLKEGLGKWELAFVFEELSQAEYRKRRDAGDYDLAYQGYIGNFADPDGFIDSLNFPGVDVNSGNLLKKIAGIRFEPSNVARLSAYSKVLREFEDEWTVVPLFQTQVPIIHHKDIVIPDTHYRYEAELWSFLWKSN